MDVHAKASAMGFGVVMLTQVASLIIRQIQSGRSGLSHLDKTIALEMDRHEAASFTATCRQRLAALGFTAADDGSNFLQGGADLRELGSASHAKTNKLLTLKMRDSENDRVSVTLTLRYLDMIVVDTGESAYRDAVLDFVSGKTNEMVTVPNESLMAMNSLVGGGLACVISALLIVFNTLDFWQMIPIIGVTEFAVGALALVAIIQKPAEITGFWQAVAGIVLSLAAIASSLVFIILIRENRSL